ncbi:membrane glycoprotein UL16 [Panine betaherpesvirus 2]|uniref:Membrane glycoprotein UL16 n=1 Tax=Panine betaherpesvirus 2 TaxID=188763 RepID=Q8QS71_9BETA|nr:membrane glycoprotein UL16 [Panine betaherpesvirus 2]AAM00666.1 membrane glycoprotein UL16 [Panine betaherpesvirus 2]QXV67768.1 membrane glycoprotein UL16 [Panine betaherpesvirus 2]
MAKDRGSVPMMGIAWILFVGGCFGLIDLEKYSNCTYNATVMGERNVTETWTSTGICLSICYYSNVSDDEVLGVAFVSQYNESYTDAWLYKNGTEIRNFTVMQYNILQNGLQMRHVPWTKLYTHRIINNHTAGRYDCFRCKNGTLEIVERTYVKLGSLYKSLEEYRMMRHPSMSGEEDSEPPANLARDVMIVSGLTLLFFLLGMRIPQRLFQRLKLRFMFQRQRLRDGEEK